MTNDPEMAANATADIQVLSTAIDDDADDADGAEDGDYESSFGRHDPPDAAL